jgi:hypothetical protein
MEEPTSSGGSRNRLTRLNLHERDDDKPLMVRRRVILDSAFRRTSTSVELQSTRYFTVFSFRLS